MALQLGALYEALLARNDITPDQARAAAEEVAAYERRMSAVERDLSNLKWMVGTNIVLTLLIVGQMFALTWKVSDLTGQVSAVAAQVSALARGSR